MLIIGVATACQQPFATGDDSVKVIESEKKAISAMPENYPLLAMDEVSIQKDNCVLEIYGNAYLINRANNKYRKVSEGDVILRGELMYLAGDAAVILRNGSKENITLAGNGAEKLFSFCGEDCLRSDKK